MTTAALDDDDLLLSHAKPCTDTRFIRPWFCCQLDR